jgi:N-acetylglucosamine-6-phosphate deacetylase
MNAGALSALHYETGKPVRLTWESGLVTGLWDCPTADSDLWLAPTLCDLQVNGFAGIDFQQDGLTAENLLLAVHQLRAAGCARFLLTLVTAPWDRLLHQLRQLQTLRRQSAELQAAIAGWHLEGPFLSPEPGFHGAHEPSWMCDATPHHLRQLREITTSERVLLTLAPERSGAIDAIALAVSLGFTVNLGHTNASIEILRQAMAAGATGFTHLGNGCPRDLDRHDNILWRVMELPQLQVSLIPDKIHVSPALFRLLHRIIDPGHIHYVSDAMSAAGPFAESPTAPDKPRRFTLGNLEVEVGIDQIVRHPGKTNFAGSALRPIDGVFRAAQMLDCSWQETWKRFSDQPARYIGLPAGLQTGQRANFCLLRVGHCGAFQELRVFVQGVEYSPTGNRKDA